MWKYYAYVKEFDHQINALVYIFIHKCISPVKLNKQIGGQEKYPKRRQLIKNRLALAILSLYSLKISTHTHWRIKLKKAIYNNFNHII